MPWEDMSKNRAAQAAWHRRKRASMTPEEHAEYRDRENQRFRERRAKLRAEPGDPS